MEDDLKDIEALFAEKNRKANAKELNEVPDEDALEVNVLFKQKRELLGADVPEELAVSPNSLVGMGLVSREDAELFNNSLMDKATRAMMDVVTTFGTGSLAAAPALGAGLLEASLPSGDYESAKKAMEDTMSALTIEPKSDEGQYVMGQVGDFFSFITEFQEAAGDKTYDLTDSDILATAAYAFPDVIAGIIGAKGVAGKLNNTKKTFQEDPLTKQRLSEGDEGADLAPVKLDSKGNVVKDKVAINALREGIPAREVSGIKNASRADKAKMRQAIAIRTQQNTNKSSSRNLSTYDVVGQSFVSVLDALDKRRRTLGQNLEGVVKSDVFKNTNVDLSPGLQKFGEALEKQGLIVKPILEETSFGSGKIKRQKPTGRYKLDFDNSKVMNMSDEFKATLDEAVNVLYAEAPGGVVSARKVHEIKKKMDDLIDYEMVGAGGQSGVKSLNYSIFELRKGMDDMLDGMFPDSYGKVNAELSPILEQAGFFKKYLGEFKDGSAAGKKRAGQLLGAKFKGGNKRGEDVSEAAKLFRQRTQEVQRTLKEQSVKTDYNIDHQLNFLDTLNSLEKFGDMKGVRGKLYSMGEGARIMGNLSPSLLAKTGLYLAGGTLRTTARIKDADANLTSAVNRRMKALDNLVTEQSVSPWDINK